MTGEAQGTAEAPATTGDDGALSALERAAAFSGGPPKMSRKVVYWTLGILLVLGVGGGMVENVLNSSGSSGTPPKPVPLRYGPASPALSGPLPAFLGVVAKNRPAPAFTLSTAAGTPLALAALRGRAVVLSFFGARCNDICPVLGAELRAAAARLGPSAPVTFLTVNTDPAATSTHAAALATARAGLGSLTNYHFLTGPLSRLSALWKSYGVTVDYFPALKGVSHTDVLYLIDPTGRIRYALTPFANESRSGAYTLSAASVARFGAGITTYLHRIEH